MATTLMAYVISAILGDIGIAAAGASQQPAAESAAADQPPVRVGGSVNRPPQTRQVPPVYPALAKAARVQGVVVLETTVGRDGKVVGSKVVTSIPLLDAAATEAVKQWEFAPTIVDGSAVSVILTTTVTFALDGGRSRGAPEAPPATTPPTTSQGATGLAESLRNLQAYLRREEFAHPQEPAANAIVQVDTMGVEFGPWLRRFVAQLKRNWTAPSATTERGRTVVRFQVHRNGLITHVTVVTSSKLMSLDAISQRAVQASSPAEPLPAQYKNDFALFTVSFTYNEPPTP